ncbi:MAG: polysaccharide deacetylase family protein [Halioglobus sp.]
MGHTGVKANVILRLRTAGSACVLFAILLGFSGGARAADNAVILLYHHVSGTTPASTSVSPAVFEQHFSYLAEGFNVISLEQVINQLAAGKPLPERAVAITFDDGYGNIYENAHPLLTRYGMPYTVFINPPLIGRQGYQLSWEQVAEMERGGARFANHTMQHTHLLERKKDEKEAGWLSRIRQDILDAEVMLQERLGYSLRYIAYPYGEFDNELKTLVSDLGFVGFGQHSGAIFSGSDYRALPRFAAAGSYAKLDSLKVKINSLALPVTGVRGTSNSDGKGGEVTAGFTFTFDSGDLAVKQLACYFRGRPLPVSVVYSTVSVSLPGVPPIGRSRVNCTGPSNAEVGRYYWYSYPWFTARADGTYPD